MTSFQTVVLPTAYVPPVHYFSYLIAAECVLIEQFETYPKQTYRNRCEIMTANGKFSLTIPVVKTFGNHTKTSDIGISSHQNWQLVHWRTIESAYANSPYFLYYKDMLLPFYQKKYDNLLHYNTLLLNVILEMLGMHKKIELTTTYLKNLPGGHDLRNTISPKRPVHDFPFKEYYQVFADKQGFLPGLSILDLIFNMGGQAVEILDVF